MIFDPQRAVKRYGKHYTPTPLAEFLAERILAQLDDRSNIRILDPACGDGELLFALHRLVSQRDEQVTVSLVGYDLDEAAVEVARSRSESLGIAVEWHVCDFLEAGAKLPAGSFDVIITNPPYVRTQQLGSATAQLLADEFGLTGRIDLTHPFVAMVPSLLRPKGVLGLLCSNRFLTTKAGANVRSIFRNSLQPVELFDLGDTRLFRAAVLPAVLIAQNQRPVSSARCIYHSAYEDREAEPSSERDLYGALTAEDDSVVSHAGRTIAVKAGILAQSDSPSSPWRLSHQVGDAWLARIEAATWRTFGDVAKIRVGIKTTADSVFISDQWDQRDPKPESELLLPLITHDNVTKWRISDHVGTRVLYPYDLRSAKRRLLEMDRYPESMAYLESHAERLKGRQYVVDGGREWYEIWVPQRPSAWAAPKIVFPDISVDARFALDLSGAVVNGDCYWISLDDIGSDDLALLMLAVANSTLGRRFYDEVCGNKLYAGRRRWITQYVTRLPLPDPHSQASRVLIDATRELLADSGSGTAANSRIDALVQAAFSEPTLSGTQQEVDGDY